jgi:preprotein translocase subunit SecD
MIPIHRSISSLCLALAAGLFSLPGCAPPGRQSGAISLPAVAPPAMVKTTLRAQTETLKGRTWTDADLEATRVVVEKRAHLISAGVTKVSAVAPDKIVLEALRSLNPEDVLRITTPNRIRFCLLPQLGKGTGDPHATWSLVRGQSSHEILTDAKSGARVTDAQLDRDVFARRPELAAEDFLPGFQAEIDTRGVPHIAFELTEPAAARFATMERSHSGEFLAIFIDHKLITVPIMNGPITGKGIIEGGFTPQQAHDMAELLNTGELPVPLTSPGIKSRK